MNRTFFIFIILFAMTLTAHASPHKETGKTHNHKWKFSVTAGGALIPSYRGDDEYRFNIVPDISLKYRNRFFASLLGGVGYNAFITERWRIGPIAKYDFGRDEDGSRPTAVGGNDTNDLIGLGDVNDSVEIGGFVEYSYNHFSAAVELRQGINGHKGMIGEAKLKYGGTITAFKKTIFYSMGPEVVFGDSNYNRAFYGINATQSAASGLSRFDAEGSLISYGIHSSVFFSINKHISMIGFAGYDRLGGDPADSPLVQERGSKNQGRVGLLISYTFLK